MRLPRILPLVAVAGAGVLAINVLENGPGVVGAARGFAEALAAKPGQTPKPAAAAAAATPADATPVAPAVVAAHPAPVCAPSPSELAREAGLSPAELQVLQSLGARRGQLDQREQGLDTEVSLLAAASAKVDARIAAMNAMKAEMQTMLGQLDDKQQAEVDRLVKVFEAMKPADAAARFTLLTDEVRLPIAARMKERALSAMIAKMSPPEAKRLTEALAARYVAQANAARQAMNPPAAAATPAPAAATAPAAPAKPPAQVAQAAAPATPAGASAATPAPTTPAKPPARRRPRPQAHHPDPSASAAAPQPAAPAGRQQASAAPAAGAPAVAPASAAPAARPAATAAGSPSPAPTPSPAPAAPARPG